MSDDVVVTAQELADTLAAIAQWVNATRLVVLAMNPNTTITVSTTALGGGWPPGAPMPAYGGHCQVRLAPFPEEP